MLDVSEIEKTVGCRGLELGICEYDKQNIKELEVDLKRLAHDAEFQELLKIIHRPGYTTPAEFTLTVGIVNTMIAQTRALAALKQALLLGNREIVEKAAGAAGNA